MNITISNNIVVENLTTGLINWCKANLRLSNPEYAKKARMGFWVGDTPKTISLYETRGTTLILPYGATDLIPSELLEENEIIYDFTNNEVIDYNANIPLRDYQEKAVNNMLIAGHGILQAPAGSGKSRCGIAILTKWKTKALWLCHTKDLINQAKTMAEEFIDKDLIGTITEGKVNIGKGVTFATVQTMCKLDLSQYKNLWGTILVDECFSFDTKILTNKGYKNICDISIGDKVLSYNHDNQCCEFRVVTNIYRKKSDDFWSIKSASNEIVCTPNHPIFTKRGYIKAERITESDYVLCDMWEENRNDKRENLTHNILSKYKTRICVLFERLFYKRGSRKAFENNDTRNKGTIFGKNESIEQNRTFYKKQRENENFAKSNDKPKDERKSIQKIKRNGTSTSCQGWQWKRVDCSTKKVNGKTKPLGGNSRICHSNKEEGWLSELLQNRHSNIVQENSNRNRWEFPFFSKSTTSRQKKDRVSHWRGLDGSSVQKSRSFRKYRECFVYNLEVDGNNNYFANGMLVHNCHRVSGSPTRITQYQKVLNNLSARHKYGLSATVHRADGLEQCMFSLVGKVAYQLPDEAVAENIMQVGIRRVGTGIEISREALNTDGTINYARLINYLTQNDDRNRIISENIEKRPSLVLSERVTQLKLLLNMLPKGMRENAVMITGKSKKAEREKALDDMRTGKKKYLFATYQLAKEGLNIPCLERLYMASPVKDYAVVTQAIGRIARTCEGKSDPICYDFVDNIGYCVKAYKQRVRTYKKNNCYFVEE